uniref:TLC domain-containing protein n=1 Tax=viral metagenome TaxID=1070528 RepID=A0A6C0DUR3_9ZZZZ
MKLLMFLFCISFLIVVFFCYDYYYVYNYIVNELNKQKERNGMILPIKQRAYILSIKSTCTMSLCGIYFNYMFCKAGLNIDVYMDSLGVFSNTIGYVLVLNFISYLMMDCYMGYNNYPIYMNTLAGYIHHSVYIVINICALYTGLYPYYLIYMILEIPSVLLNIGSYDAKWRNDRLFGIVFFTTRIVYHIYLTYVLWNIVIIRNFALPILCVHIYWFKNWFTKYGISILKNN